MMFLRRSLAVRVVRRGERFLSDLRLDGLIVTAAAAKRIAVLKTNDGEASRLRLGVDGGGCSGFQYTFTTEAATAKLAEDDSVFSRDGHDVVVDETSLEFVRGATVDYQEEMIRSAFVVINNPNSESACGCGSSFALKNFDSNPAID
uniref:Core domain-containing protein n=1 Tax=Aureoumbra lagunensis TaxID=44058 RepID=A0A7S3NJQ0_9STRA|mmetsp:Transcript_13271/g.17724  ORF Transcript_13271/g.17724 Transcript_13271/m.17724 type:complete len:147 (-) Transcript_13271:47-487(-)